MNCSADSVITTCTVAPAWREQAHQLGNLVAGDTATHPDQDVAAAEAVGKASCTSPEDEVPDPVPQPQAARSNLVSGR